MNALIGVVGIVLGAVGGGFVTYLTTRSRMRLELEYAYDRELREKRLPHYQRLFHISRAVPRQWPPNAVPSRAELRVIRAQFHNWYFGADAGGMFLTEAARKLYFDLQNGLETAARGPDVGGTTLTEDEQLTLYELASALRHRLSADVGTTQSPRLPWTSPEPTVAPPSRMAAPRRAGPT